MIDRRLLLKVAGSLAAASALGMGCSGVGLGTPPIDEPVAAPQPVLGRAETALRPPGTYQFSGTVRLQAPLVEISGVSNTHQISWSPGALHTPVASFTSFEHFTEPWPMPTIRIEGGQLETMHVVPLSFA
jgi:hypothetical protein